MKNISEQLPDGLPSAQDVKQPGWQAVVDGHAGGALSTEVEQTHVAVPVETGLTAVQVQELVENRVASLFHLSNMDHPVQVALRQLSISRITKKLRNSL